ncbi:threonine/serine exporter [Weissella viridescens]|uniref:Threonine/serine exporter n=1 Tax=Weissella viridescens TaxID=1629 RepID=A0A3P2RA01_WEIVI|nr:threonine/serine exporter family protein [Weissella viridescens]RRG17649.1 threonine/serine exporter [Weissella viridescens]
MTNYHILMNMLLSFTAALGFGIITNVPKRSLIPSGTIGMLVWIVYHGLSIALPNSLVLPNLMGGLIIGLLSQAYGSHYHVSSNVVAIPAMVSLVPGSGAYEAMKLLITPNHSSYAAHAQFHNVFVVAVSITIGFFLAEFVTLMIGKLNHSRVKSVINETWRRLL